MNVLNELNDTYLSLLEMAKQGKRKYMLYGKSNHLGRQMWRIMACRDFGSVVTGDLGGFIENSDNLSQSGNCWVGDEACVYDGAKVYGDALVYENAIVHGKVEIYDKAQVCGTCLVYSVKNYFNVDMPKSVRICGSSRVRCNSVFGTNVFIHGNANLYGMASVWGKADIDYESDELIHDASGELIWTGNSWVREN